MSNDPSARHRFPHEQRRYRGMGQGERERFSMLRQSIEEICDCTEEPWVLDRIRHRGLAYAMPPDEEYREHERRAVGFPRPSWYAIYKKQKRVVRR
jgi:hypothetical protein